MSTLLTNIGRCATKVIGQKTTRYSQQEVVDRLAGGLSICDARMEDPAACRALMDTYRLKHGIVPTKNLACQVPEHMDMYNRYVPESEQEPVYSGVFDLKTFIRVLQLGTSDLGATVTAETTPRDDIGGSIQGWKREESFDLDAFIHGKVNVEGNLYASVRGWISVHTQPLEYEETIIISPSGMSILKRLITKLPDLTAFIYGWEYVNLGASILVRSTDISDIGVSIYTIGQNASNLMAVVVSTYIEDVGGSVNPIPYVPLNGILTTVPPVDLPTTLVPIPPSDLYAVGGGHYPKDLLAYLIVQQPIPLYAWIRVGGEGPEDLLASIIAAGAWIEVGARIKAMVATSVDLPVSITCRIPVDIRGYIKGWDELDITAWIIGVRSNDIGGWITPWYRGNEKNISSFIRASWGGIIDLEPSIYGWVSTHTSDKIPNVYLLQRFPENILIGQSRGLTILKVETVWGVFPDLHASIVGMPFYTTDLLAYILPMVRSDYDLSAVINAVTQTIHITKIPINMVNISDLSVYISAFSGYLPLTANIRGISETNTTTDSNSRWIYTSSSVRFYLGTDKGLVIPSRRQSVIRPSLFLNTGPTPDLWACVYGWELSDLGASITVQPYSVLTGQITSQDLSHMFIISASITSVYTKDLVASITGSGGFTDISANISSLGGVLDLAASIKPYLKILGFRLIPVETQPFFDLRAIVNPTAACGLGSTYSNITAFIRAGSVASEQGILYASIHPLTDRLEITASIVGRLYTRIKLIDISFRTKTRYSDVVTAIIVGVGKGTYDITACIKGMPHEFDLTASIAAVRYRLATMDPIGLIPVYKERGQLVTLYKELLLSFSSQVVDYIYDAIDSAVYEIGDGRWVLDLSEFTSLEDFYDRDGADRNRSIDDITEYGSVDEAIRETIRILTEMYQTDLTASITSTGGYLGLNAVIEGLYKDRVLDLPASVTIVNNLPDLYASISAFSGYNPMKAFIVGYASESPTLNADIYGVVYTSIDASIVGVI